MEATERMSPVPPPFNLPITVTAFLAEILRATPLAFLLPVDPTGGKPPYDYSKNKKIKGKVARKLMLKLRKRNEEIEEVTLDSYVEQLDENQQGIKQQLKDVMDAVESIQTSLSSKK